MKLDSQGRMVMPPQSSSPVPVELGSHEVEE
jgi:hypothetical protein